MPLCENFSKCKYFIENMKNSPSTAALVQSNYCKNMFQECARYMIFQALGEAKVPPDLSPSETEVANKILREFH